MQTPTDSPDALGPWIGPKLVGTGWDIFTSVLPAGGFAFYGLMPDGELRWYSHNGFNNGTPDWNGPKTVGTGWGGFKAIVSGSDGVLYAIQPDGQLLWYRHLDFIAGSPDWEGPREVGTGWQNFRTAFGDMSGAPPAQPLKGVIYAVRPDGTVLWYRHDGWETGDPGAWTGPVTVATGLTGYRQLFPFMSATPNPIG
jgi:hypothetical protein